MRETGGVRSDRQERGGGERDRYKWYKLTNQYTYTYKHNLM